MPDFHGLIQHSFALQLAERHRPFRGRENLERVRERFALSSHPGDPYSVNPARKLGHPNPGVEDPFAHTPLGQHRLTTVGSRSMLVLRPDTKSEGALPDALSWAGRPGSGSEKYSDPRLIFADRYDDERRATDGDFRVIVPHRYAEEAKISAALFEVIAHKRSRLFSFALANRFVNVMLPHATLHGGRGASEGDAWFMQPFVSFIRGGRDRGRLRNTYSLTFLLVPVSERAAGKLAARSMSPSEIASVLNAGWGYAASRPMQSTSHFFVAGPLLGYLSRLAGFDVRQMARPSRHPTVRGLPACEMRDRLTFRQTVEKVAFGVGLSLAQGSSGRADERTMRRIGNDALMALGSARVSSVVVTDKTLGACAVRKPAASETFPGGLQALMEELADPIRIADPGDPSGREYRLDQPFVDSDLYAAGVLPTKRCVVVVSRAKAQHGARESALMQAGSVAYLTLGAASAIGTLRVIDSQVEALEGAKPTEVALIDRDVAADLNEIYDLDITAEAYREFYRRLRDRLGITRDYEILRDEMNTLHRAASTVHDDSAQRLLAWLTAGIVGLSLLILIGTVVLVGNGG